MVSERTLTYSLRTPNSIYFRMVVDTEWIQGPQAVTVSRLWGLCTYHRATWSLWVYAQTSDLALQRKLVLFESPRTMTRALNKEGNNREVLC